MKRITVELEDDLLQAVMRLTGARTASEAVNIALGRWIEGGGRYRSIRELRGKLEWEGDVGAGPALDARSDHGPKAPTSSQAQAIARARQIWRMVPGSTVPTKVVSSLWRTVNRLQRLTQEVCLRPCSMPSATSEGAPRSVEVTVATVTV